MWMVFFTNGSEYTEHTTVLCSCTLDPKYIPFTWPLIVQNALTVPSWMACSIMKSMTGITLTSSRVGPRTWIIMYKNHGLWPCFVMCTKCGLRSWMILCEKYFPNMFCNRQLVVGYHSSNKNNITLLLMHPYGEVEYASLPSIICVLGYHPRWRGKHPFSQISIYRPTLNTLLEYVSSPWVENANMCPTFVMKRRYERRDTSEQLECENLIRRKFHHP